MPIGLIVTVVSAADVAGSEADRLRLTGRYEEADALYKGLATSEPLRAAIGQARCALAQGKTDVATKLLADAAAKHPDEAVLAAEMARIAFDHGDYDSARRHVDAAF
ncbi:MAG: tetratricopeptide repeat protein, partial [Planctomycetota bacterium]|nr:tetratricopeptide repeat protein [Planctomycetota bacterium]